jgi:chromosome segregation ATPase
MLYVSIPSGSIDISVLMYLYQASITDLIISSLPDSRNVDNLSLADAMNIASRARTTQYARKYGMLHEIFEWEVHLNNAKDRVYECEETIRKLREEVDATDGQLEKIDNGLEEIKCAMEAQRLADSTGDIDIDDSRSTVSWHSGA